MGQDTKGITPAKAKTRPGTWKPSPAKKGASSKSAPATKMPYRKQGK